MLIRALAAPSQGLLGWGRRLAPGRQQTRAFVKYVGFRRAAPTTWKSRLAYTVLPAGILFAGAYAYLNREEVLFTRRSRLRLSGHPDVDKDLGKAILSMILEDERSYKHSNDQAEREIQRLVESRFQLLRKYVESLDLPYVDWDVHVVRKRDVNAMCLPGGKMVVYTGLLSFFADLYEEGKLSVHPVHALDVVLAHEMSHAICRHAIEGNHGLVSFILPLCTVLSVESPLLIHLSTYLLELPFSRTLEEEADHVALILLAKACIDPAIAPTVLQALADMGGWSMLTSWLSTHPQGEYRAELAKAKLAQVERDYMPDSCPVRGKETDDKAFKGMGKRRQTVAEGVGALGWNVEQGLSAHDKELWLGWARSRSWGGHSK